MANENLAPRDAKVISVILRSLGIEECEPKVITQLLEFVYKYSTDIMMDADLFSKHCGRESISAADIKLSLQSKVGKYFLPAPPRSFLQASADYVNSKPLTMPDSENLLRTPVPSMSVSSMEYEIEQKEQSVKKRRVC
ncbi:hypothetical protein ENBRE01_0403 [Enteropsectra breve]|nr:hypothetical protein ENBRE01_0403 [Enteropsectra breve]